jgi:hypothetical protein
MLSVKGFWMRITATVLIVLQLQACTNWKPQALAPDAQLPELVRITLLDGSRVTLEDPSIVGDSLVGTSRFSRGVGLRKVAVHIGEIATVESKEYDGEGTELFPTLAFSVVILVGFFALALASLDFGTLRFQQ